MPFKYVPRNLRWLWYIMPIARIAGPLLLYWRISDVSQLRIANQFKARTRFRLFSLVPIVPQLNYNRLLKLTRIDMSDAHVKPWIGNDFALSKMCKVVCGNHFAAQC